jgi:hypothetical protein
MELSFMTMTSLFFFLPEKIASDRFSSSVRRNNSSGYRKSEPALSIMLGRLARSFQIDIGPASLPVHTATVRDFRTDGYAGQRALRAKIGAKTSCQPLSLALRGNRS